MFLSKPKKDGVLGPPQKGVCRGGWGRGGLKEDIGVRLIEKKR